MERPSRRANDQNVRGDRRALPDRRRDVHWSSSMRFPGWGEQKVQFLTRYLFCFLGVVFFNFSGQILQGNWLSVQQINFVFGLYFLFNTLAFFHARKYPESAPRYRIAMWVDIALVALCVLHDPYTIPPSILAFIMVVLGNGMRYGMRMFGEALTGSFAGAMVALSLRNITSADGLTPGVMFLNLFGGIILVYAYILMSRIENSRRELERQSNIDTLTGLMNRRALFDIAEFLFERMTPGRNLVVMFADLNKFKAINDTYGHTVGDEVLREFAATLQDCMRGSDVAARYGGDEFVLLLPNTALEEAHHVAQRLLARTEEYARKKQIDVGVSIGIGEAPTHGQDLDTLLHQVDQVMYQAKSEGRNFGMVS